MMTALQLYDCARRRGLCFKMIGPSRVEVSGPPKIISALGPAIDAQAPEIIALVAEFSEVSAPVAAALSILAVNRERACLDVGGHQRTR
jgi:hypothetical protein